MKFKIVHYSRDTYRSQTQLVLSFSSTAFGILIFSCLLKVRFSLLSSFSRSTFFFLLSMDLLKVKHGELSKGEGSLRRATMSVPCCSSSVSQPSGASIHISGDEEQDVPIGGFLANQWTLHSFILNELYILEFLKY